MDIFKKKITDFILSLDTNDYKTLRKRKVLARQLKEFEVKNGLTLYTNSFSEEINDRFLSFLRSYNIGTPDKAKYYLTNTIKSKCEALTALLNKAYKHGYKVNLDALGKFNIRAVTPEKIYLTMEELEYLNNMKLKGAMAQTRDLFLIGCLTALRFSDYSNLSAENFKNGTITLITKKTKTRVVVPIHPIIEGIIKRRGGYEFLKYGKSLSNFNFRLTALMKKAKFNKKYHFEVIRGNQKVMEHKYKWEMITSHTARRTGATLMYLAGIPPFRIMLITGHATEEAFYKYIRIQKEENAQELMEHPFFHNNK